MVSTREYFDRCHFPCNLTLNGHSIFIDQKKEKKKHIVDNFYITGVDNADGT